MTTLLVLARTLHVGSAMLLVALPYFMLAVFRPVLAPSHAAAHLAFARAITRWLWCALFTTALSGLVWFWLVAAQMNEQPLSAPLTLAQWETVLTQTQFGLLWLGRLVLGLALGATLHLASRRKTFTSPHASFLGGLILLLSNFLLITLAWAGHAAAGIHLRAFHLLVDILHLALGSIWPMGLLPLSLFLWHFRRQDSAIPADPSIQILTTFSRTSLAAVLLLILTGFVNAWLMIGTWSALATTPYGHLLLAKVAVVVLMIGLGACNRLYFIPRLSYGAPLFNSLRKTILAESCLAVVVLLIVGIMGMTSPPS